MALFHLHAKIISRSDGSAVAAAAYRSGEKLTNDYDGITSDYSRKRYVDDAIVLLPYNAPEDFADRGKLWNAVEQNEKSVNAQLAREIEFALPVELPVEERERIALEYIQEQFVDRGMVADVCFHKRHKRKNPEEEINANPHCHVMLTLRPMDETGKWEPKNTTMYFCEKDGIQKLLTAKEIKEDSGWEKLYSYIGPSGEKEWHTKSFVEEQGEDAYTLVNKYPKRETVLNPKLAEWNSTESLQEWRRAWAEKVNLAYEAYGMDLHIDHRSYKEQGLDLIPMVHEGKTVTAIERKLQKEYDQKIASGETVVMRHTEIHDLNNAIREHNHELRIIAEMKKLRAQMEAIIAPVMERIEAFEQNLAEKLEQLRAEIISLTVKIRRAVDLKGKAAEQIISNEAYIKDLAPAGRENVEELDLERRSLKKQLETTTGLFSGKKRDDLAEKIEAIDSELSLLKENRKYAIDAQKEIKHLQGISESIGTKIEQMEAQRDELAEEYFAIEAKVPQEKLSSILMERQVIRSEIESEYIKEAGALNFQSSAESIDKTLGCSIPDLSQDTLWDPIKHNVKLS